MPQLKINRDVLMEHPEWIDDIRKEAKATLELAKRIELVLRLQDIEEWGRFDWGVLVKMANPVDEPFVKLMISLSKRGYKYNVISMHRWWRRLKAVSQQHIISYFTYIGFPDPCSIDWQAIYQKCCRTADIFKAMANVYQDDKSVEMNLRAMLGCSQQADIKEAWTKWAKQNHPDKGGSVDKFILVKAAYEEWQDVNR